MLFGRVRVVCPTCGPVEVRGADVTVLSRLEEMRSLYRFDCPTCSASIVRSAGPGIVTMLLRAGAQVERRHPSLALDARPDRWVAPLNNDDLVAFCEQLERLPTASPEAPN